MESFQSQDFNNIYINREPSTSMKNNESVLNESSLFLKEEKNEQLCASASKIKNSVNITDVIEEKTKEPIEKTKEPIENTEVNLIMKEIVNTERKYATDMMFLKDRIKLYISKKEQEGILDPHEKEFAQYMMSHLEKIIKCSLDFCKDIKENPSVGVFNENFDKNFADHDVLDSYIFISNFSRGEVQTSFKKNLKNFAINYSKEIDSEKKIELNNTENKEHEDRLNLFKDNINNFFSKPTQRVCLYKVFIENLEKHTGSSLKLIENSKISPFAKKLDEGVDEIFRKETLEKIEEKIESKSAEFEKAALNILKPEPGIRTKAKRIFRNIIGTGGIADLHNKTIKLYDELSDLNKELERLNKESKSPINDSESTSKEKMKKSNLLLGRVYVKNLTKFNSRNIKKQNDKSESAIKIVNFLIKEEIIDKNGVFITKDNIFDGLSEKQKEKTKEKIKKIAVKIQESEKNIVVNLDTKNAKKIDV